jgi:hypothetical protein
MYVSKSPQTGLLPWQKSDSREACQFQNVPLTILPIPLSLFVQATDTDPRARPSHEWSEHFACGTHLAARSNVVVVDPLCSRHKKLSAANRTVLHTHLPAFDDLADRCIHRWRRVFREKCRQLSDILRTSTGARTQLKQRGCSRSYG